MMKKNHGGRIMKLTEMLDYPYITIQCHDNPDPDAIASGFAIWTFLQGKGCHVRLIYGGVKPMTKANLILMCQLLSIQMEHVTTQEQFGRCDLLVVVDAQYGAGNVTKFECDNVWVIDHHQEPNRLPSNVQKSLIRPNIGSCATILWDLLLKSDYPVNKNIPLGTALYYGLASDTKHFSEVYHPLDKDLRDMVAFNNSTITRLYNTNLSVNELTIAGDALNDFVTNASHRYAYTNVAPCDPNILGIVSDMLIQVDCVDSCVAFSDTGIGYKLSVRSSVAEIRADELARYLCSDIGSGGGHKTKAGGFISKNLYNGKHPGINFDEYIDSRMTEYHTSSTIMHTDKDRVDTSLMKKYIKSKVVLGVAFAKDFLPTGMPLLIRTLEGDIDIVAADDTCLMVGIKGEVYPITMQKFNRTYSLADMERDEETEYQPRITNRKTGDSYPLMPFLNTCVPKQAMPIFAKRLEKRLKIFTAWDSENYYLGDVGDYLAVRIDDPSDYYIIEGDVFERTYSAFAD